MERHLRRAPGGLGGKSDSATKRSDGQRRLPRHRWLRHSRRLRASTLLCLIQHDDDRLTRLTPAGNRLRHARRRRARQRLLRLDPLGAAHHRAEPADRVGRSHPAHLARRRRAARGGTEPADGHAFDLRSARSARTQRAHSTCSSSTPHRRHSAEADSRTLARSSALTASSSSARPSPSRRRSSSRARLPSRRPTRRRASSSRTCRRSREAGSSTLRRSGSRRRGTTWPWCVLFLLSTASSRS